MRSHGRFSSVQARPMKLVKLDWSPTQSRGGLHLVTYKFGNKSTDSTTSLGFGSLKILEERKEHFSVVTAAKVLCAGNAFWFLLSSAFRRTGALLDTKQVS